MLGEANISVSQQADVLAFVSDQIASGSSLGAIYGRAPIASQAIDDLCSGLARHVLQVSVEGGHPAPRDKWLQSAYALIGEKKPPLPDGYSAETNVDRLIRWVDPKCDRILIGVIPKLDDAGLRDTYAVAEWMNRASDLPVAVVHGMPVVPRRKRAALRSSLEEALWNHLQVDPELSGLFEPNAIVITTFQTSPRVDFLWRAGYLIVEIDSYYHHSHREQFADDRQRDYETGASGYLTLRLTDDELSTDISLAVQKIRRYVQIRKRIFYV